MECWGIYQHNLRENQKLTFSFLNYLQDEMAFMAGLPSLGPKIKIPQPNVPVTMNTTNNIRVGPGSQVGQINAGALVYLNNVVTALKDGEGAAFASALQTFTQQVVDSQQLSSDSQKEILDLLRCLIEEGRKKQENRNLSVLKLAFQNIGSLVTVAQELSTHWDKLKSLFEVALR